MLDFELGVGDRVRSFIMGVNIKNRRGMGKNL